MSHFDGMLVSLPRPRDFLASFRCTGSHFIRETLLCLFVTYTLCDVFGLDLCSSLALLSILKFLLINFVIDSATHTGLRHQERAAIAARSAEVH